MKNGSPFHRRSAAQSVTRREFLWRSGGGLGGIALASLLGGERALASGGMFNGKLHHTAKAKRVVTRHLVMTRKQMASYLEAADLRLLDRLIDYATGRSR